MELRTCNKILGNFHGLTLEALNEYVEFEINQRYKKLINVTDPIQIYQLQGEVKALRSVLNIRKTAEQIVELNRNGGN